MTDADKILQALERLESGQQAMREDIKSLQTDVKGLQGDVKSLKEGQDTLELKVETIVALQQKASAQSQHDHQEIMGHLLKNADIHDDDHKAVVMRVDQIEKHLNLPPIK